MPGLDWEGFLPWHVRGTMRKWVGWWGDWEGRGCELARGGVGGGRGREGGGGGVGEAAAESSCQGLGRAEGQSDAIF